jgi:hypothetical protein
MHPFYLAEQVKNACRLKMQVRLAVEAGAIAYVPSGRGAREEEEVSGEEAADSD